MLTTILSVSWPSFITIEHGQAAVDHFKVGFTGFVAVQLCVRPWKKPNDASSISENVPESLSDILITPPIR